MTAHISQGLWNLMQKEAVRNRLRQGKCPICGGIESCDHTMLERLRAKTDHDYRDRLRAEDPLYQLQQERRRARAALKSLGDSDGR